jgi:hypothetical protein
MDSWISINHDIEYDALTGILSAQERRILDSIKGLAQTGEVLLEQLHHVNIARRKEDEALLREPGDVTRVLNQYFVLEEPVTNHSADPFDRLLLSVLLSMGICRGKQLKARLRDDGIEPYCLKPFATFRENFPISGSFESFVLPHFLKSMERRHIELMWQGSNLKPDEAKLSSILKRTLIWIHTLRHDTRFRMRTISRNVRKFRFANISLIFCIHLWCSDVSEPLGEGWLLPDMLLELFRGSILLGTERPFIMIALGENIITTQNMTVYSDVLYNPNIAYDFDLIDESYDLDDPEPGVSFVEELVKQPLELEQGVTMFLQYCENFESKREMATKTKSSEAWRQTYEKKTKSSGGWIQAFGKTSTALEAWKEARYGKTISSDAWRQTYEKISEGIFKGVLTHLPWHATFRLAHTCVTPNNTPNSRHFWDLLYEHTRVQDYSQLIDRDGKNFQPWLDKGGYYHRIIPSSGWPKISAKLPRVRDRGFENKIKSGLVVILLDCSNLSDHEMLYKFLDTAKMDIILLQNFAPSDMEYLMNILHFKRWYLGKVEADVESGLSLITIINGLSTGNLLNDDPVTLGPLWKAASGDQTFALVCDLWIHLINHMPIRLRLPNFRPGATTDAKLLPSDDDWEISGGHLGYSWNKTYKVGMFESNYMLIIERLSPDAAFNGGQVNNEADLKWRSPKHLRVLVFRPKKVLHDPTQSREEKEEDEEKKRG